MRAQPIGGEKFWVLPKNAQVRGFEVSQSQILKTYLGSTKNL